MRDRGYATFGTSAIYCLMSILTIMTININKTKTKLFFFTPIVFLRGFNNGTRGVSWGDDPGRFDNLHYICSHPQYAIAQVMQWNTWIYRHGNFFCQFVLLTWTSFIGQFVHPGVMGWDGGYRNFSSLRSFHFIRVHENLMQHSSNNISIKESWGGFLKKA